MLLLLLLLAGATITTAIPANANAGGVHHGGRYTKGETNA